MTGLSDPYGPFRGAPVKVNTLSDLLHSRDRVRVALDELLECDSLHVEGTGDLHWHKSRGVHHPARKLIALFSKNIRFCWEDGGQCEASSDAFWCTWWTSATTSFDSKCAQNKYMDMTITVNNINDYFTLHCKNLNKVSLKIWIRFYNYVIHEELIQVSCDEKKMVRMCIYG